MQQKNTLGKGLLQGVSASDKADLREPGQQHFGHTIVEFARPQSHLDFREMFLEQGQHTRGVGDVTDVDRLPRGPQQQPWRTARATNAGSERSGKQSVEKFLTIHSDEENRTVRDCSASTNPIAHQSG